MCRVYFSRVSLHHNETQHEYTHYITIVRLESIEIDLSDRKATLQKHLSYPSVGPFSLWVDGGLMRFRLQLVVSREAFLLQFDTRAFRIILEIAVTS